MENDVKLTYGVITGLVIVLAVLAFFLQGSLSIDMPQETKTPVVKTTDTSTKSKPTGTTSATTSSTSTTNTNMTIPENVTKAVITTNKGVIEFTFSTSTPIAVENFKKLTASGFYDGTRFHRVINDFMIQGGDPLSKDVSKKNMWGTGGPGYSFKDEVSPNDKMVQGVVAMANSGPSTNGSQFFIITAQAGTPWLVGKHTPFGMVTKGMDIVMLIQNVQVDGGDKPLQDIIVQKVELQ